MSTTHSPEVWTVNGDDIEVTDPDGFAAPLFLRAGATDKDMRLAAAAPRLLAASEAFLAWFKEFDGPDVWRELQAACPQLAALQAAIESAK